jgi:hypothetical protein
VKRDVQGMRSGARICLAGLAALAVALGTAGPAFAGYSTGGGFSAPGYGVRAWGMAGAAVAYGSDEASAYWNPALLSLLGRDRVGLSYVNLVPDAKARQSYAAYAHLFGRGPADEPGLEYARHVGAVVYGNLSTELSDGRSYTENTVRLAYAFSPQYFVSIGVAVNFLASSSDIGIFASKGTAIDVGLRANLSSHLTAGAVMRNALSEISFDDGFDQRLPRSLTLGLACVTGDAFAVEGDLVTEFGSIARLAMGAEYGLFSRALELRGGVSTPLAGESRVIPHLGIGVDIRDVHLDYNANFDSEEALADTHRFAVSIGL